MRCRSVYADGMDATDFHTAYIGQIVDTYVVEWQLQKDEQSEEISLKPTNDEESIAKQADRESARMGGRSQLDGAASARGRSEISITTS